VTMTHDHTIAVYRVRDPHLGRRHTQAQAEQQPTARRRPSLTKPIESAQ
jgi:hypothetical protein